MVANGSKIWLGLTNCKLLSYGPGMELTDALVFQGLISEFTFDLVFNFHVCSVLLPTSHPREDARVTRRQHYKADARASFGTGRKNLE